MKDYDELVIAFEITEQLEADVEMSLEEYRKTKKDMLRKSYSWKLRRNN
jgi:hypothetical protein